VDDETQASFEDLRRALSVEFGLIAARFDAVDRRFEAMDQRFDAVEQRVEAVRREMGVLIGDVRHEVRTVAEMVVGNTEAISELRARIGAR
jgi:tetrahydromethanopterin S-methyltransferase subunit G